MEEQSPRRHDAQEAQQQQLEAENVYRPPKQRIKESLKARGLGYPLIAVLLIVSYVTGEYADIKDFFFIERDPTLSFPYKQNTVPSWSLAFIGAIGPLFFIILTQVLIRRSPRSKYFDRRTKDIHLMIIVLGEVLAVTWLITNILKVYVGRPRPNFFAYCNYKGYRDALESGDFTNYFAQTTPGVPGTYSGCLNPKSDSRYSFPSGHASISFCGLTFLTLFLLHVTARINFKHHAIGKIIRFLIVLIPLFGAALVASSRIIDYQHYVEDTIWGALIGILGAILAFNANYGYKRPRKAGARVMFGDIQPYYSNQSPGSSTSTLQAPTTVNTAGQPANSTTVNMPPANVAPGYSDV